MIRTLISISKIAVCLALVVGLFAQGQIAVVTSDSPFDLRGVLVTPKTGVPYWPLLAGDVIKAGQTPVTITYPDGSIVILGPGSSAKVDLSAGDPVFELDSGAAHYSLKKNGAVILKTGKDVVAPKNLIGDLIIGNNRPAAGWWTAGHTTLVLAGAGGATALGVAISKGLDNPSPSGQ